MRVRGALVGSLITQRTSPEPEGASSNHTDRRLEPSDNALGRSRGGLPTEPHRLVDGYGIRLVTLKTTGQAAGSPMVLPLLADLRDGRRAAYPALDRTGSAATRRTHPARSDSTPGHGGSSPSSGTPRPARPPGPPRLPRRRPRELRPERCHVAADFAIFTRKLHDPLRDHFLPL